VIRRRTEADRTRGTARRQSLLWHGIIRGRAFIKNIDMKSIS
jgi:hypothetical protein